MYKFLVECEHLPVPVDFVKNHLKDANGAYVKVYLYILYLAANKSEMDFSQIARELNLIESDVLNAVNYWKDAGVLNETNGCIYIGRKTVNSNVENETKVKKERIKPEYDSLQVAKDIADSDALSDMMNLCQDIFGRILVTGEMESIYWFYDGLGFSPEAILLLLEHCISRGKTNMKYIEKVALSWSEKGAVDADKVCEIIKAEEEKNGYLYSLRKVMGIADRALSQSEEKYLLKWRNDMAMSEEMVALSYEYCIIQTARLSFPYMDKIIERWFKEGIHDIASAEEDNRKFKGRREQQKPDNKDYDDLENLTRGRFDEN